ncbi:MAG: tetratricopeptide repeat protein [Rhodospirillales bacterium]|mgnify:CR=1 FL=1|jgi:tetratricopeptide (TPR) repeat protein|nr:tetratricopeptide repeat protein [Rhodospirillales bacterium]MDP6645888.1 tetratricopeptide repeat protein [Rhodospirillales bacterium]MDP6843331.1 tetratricopeptide repeat protein [Rhodospirillales bacterium]
MNSRFEGARTKPYRTLAAAALLACAMTAGPAAAKTFGTVDTKSITASPLGSYLAGRHAQYARDPDAAIEFYQATLKKFPGNRNILRRVTFLLIAEGRIDEALPLTRELAGDKGNGNNLAELLLTVEDLRNGRLQAADKTLAALPKTGLNLFSLPLIRAWVLTALNRHEEALAELDASGKNKAFTALFGAHSALINVLSKNTSQADAQFKAAIAQRNRPNLRLTQLYGNFLELSGRTEDARALYNTYMKAHPASTMLTSAFRRLEAGNKPAPEISDATEGVAEAMFSLAGSIQQQNARQALIFARLAVRLKPDFTIARLLIAEILESQQRNAAAIKEYRIIAKNPSYAMTARLRIADNFDSLDKIDDAVRELRAMARADKKRHNALVRLGDILRRRKRYREATRAYADAKARIPSLQRQHWSLLYTNGIANERIKNWAVAEADFLKALELEPGQPFVLNYLGYSWVEQGKNLDRARKMIETAAKKRPRDGYIVDSLGWVLYRLGDIEGAVKNLERAVVLRPEDPTINDHLGDVYWKVGRRNEARFQWERALALEPEPDQIGKIKKKLRGGLKDG